MGDDLWLLCCDSEEEVERILSLGRWELPGHRIRADRWMTNSGLSNVEERRGLTWVWVKRIPLHLRSEAVLRDIARILGEGTCVDEKGCTLNEIRVRLHSSMTIPHGIWLRYRGEKFWLPIVKEGSIGGLVGRKGGSVEEEGVGRPLVRPKVMSRLGSGSDGISFPKGKAAVELVDGGNQSEKKTLDGEVRGSVGGSVGVSDGGVVVGKSMMVTNHEERYNVESSFGGVQLLQEEGEIVGKVVGFEEDGGGKKGMGLKECSKLLEMFWGGPYLGLEGGPAGLSGEGFVKAQYPLKSLTVENHCVDEDSIGRLFEEEEEDNLSWAQCGEGKGPSEQMEAVDTMEEYLGRKEYGQQALVQTAFLEGTSREEGGVLAHIITEEEAVSAPLFTEEENLCKLSVEVAHLLKLSFLEDSEVAEKEVVETAKAVSGRRKKSRLEMERKRLKWDEPVVRSEEGRRDNGYVTPFPWVDES
ncbi:hypothetical protein LINPERHAP1_LOCUS3332 [Linum perenne]